MNNIISELTTRRARRGLSNQAIGKDVLDRIMNAAVLAPSCANKQPWRFMVCTEDGNIKDAREALLGGNYWAQKAPILITVMTSDELDCNLNDERHYAQFDTGMAVMALMMQATKEGLIAHPMAGFQPATLREKFSIGEETRIITMIALAHPGPTDHLNEKHLESETSDRARKPLEDIVSWENWNGLGNA